MNLPRFAVRFPVTVVMIMSAVVILGVISLDRLGTDLLPAIYNPRIVVDLSAGDRSPAEMEQRFARQLEGDLGTISHVTDVRTRCSLGRVVTTLTFSWGTDMDFALLDVQKKVARFESDPIVDRVSVTRYDPQQEPVAIYAVNTANASDLDELRRLAEGVFRRDLERLDGVARVEVYGGYAREVLVELNPYLLQAYGLTASEVTAKLQQANADASGGALVQENKSYLIKGIGKFTSIEDVAATVVGQRDRTTAMNGDSLGVGRQQPISRPGSDRVPVFLSEIARVAFAPEDTPELVRYDGQDGVGLYVYKEAQENTVRVARQVERHVARLQSGLQDVQFSRIYSQADFIEDAVGEVENTALLGMILAILVLYFFLRDAGATFIVGLAIPISVLATFTLMYFQNFTLNIMTLGGLALGAGMLVDNAIVVIENIYRRRQQGEDAVEAAVQGTNQVGVAIVASTLTTIIVFLPIVYVHGVAAELFREQAWVVAFSLFSSLVVAFLLIPSLAARLSLSERAQMVQTLRVPAYERTLHLVLKHPGRTAFAAALLLGITILLLPKIGSEFVPRSAENQVQIELTLLPGTPSRTTANVLSGVEGQIREVLGGDVAHIYATVSVSSAQDVFSAGTGDEGSRASFTLLLAEGRSPASAISRLRPSLVLPDIEAGYHVRETSLQQSIGTGGPPLVVELRGDDLVLLRQLTGLVRNALQQTPGVTTVEASLQGGRPEINLHVDRLLAASFALDVEQVALRVRERLAGEDATEFFGEGDERTVRVAYPKATLSELENLRIDTPSGAVLRLRDIADLEVAEGPIEIQRRNQSRVVYISARLDEGVILGQAVERLQPMLDQIPLPSGYELRLSGEEAERADSFAQLKFALILSIFLVYMVLASLFESLLHPFTILLTLPLAGIGVIFALLLAQEPFSIMAYIGIIMLAGIAANDSIVLVDYINRLRSEGIARREAIFQAGRDRLRPILMTSATTILALLPLTLGVGESARLRAPMAIAVIGGLVSSTLLTLLVIPAVYELIDRLRDAATTRRRTKHVAVESK